MHLDHNSFFSLKLNIIVININAINLYLVDKKCINHVPKKKMH